MHIYIRICIPNNMRKFITFIYNTYNNKYYVLEFSYNASINIYIVNLQKLNEKRSFFLHRFKYI